MKDLVTRTGVQLHVPPQGGNRITLLNGTGKPEGYTHRSMIFADLRRYRQWLMTG